MRYFKLLIGRLWGGASEGVHRASAGVGAIAAALGLVAIFATAASAQDYRLERVASGLAQPTYLSQAPGDPANILYYSTRVTTGGVGAGGGTMGSIWRYDTDTRIATEVMNLSHRGLNLDLGLLGFAFHPDFNNSAAAGYQKLYVSTAQDNGGALPINRVEEYLVSDPGFKVPVNGSNQPIVNRLILQYNNGFADDNHTIDWIGFNPAEPAQAGNAERNYMYIVTGDGSNGQGAQNRPEQKANDLLGKLLRIDVGGGDAYPADLQKNFAIPATNPIPFWNSTHDGNNQLASTTITYAGAPGTVTYGAPLQEIYFTGLRNTFGMSFDRQTGDWYGGDVGENGREEVNFMKVSTYDGLQPPRDFGYPQREGTNTGAGNSTGATTLEWDLSGGGNEIVTSVNPIREGAHASLNGVSTAADVEIRNTGRSAYIGGYVYRGPIEELQGKYIYTDFVHGNVFALEFDRDTPLASYSGTNLNRAAEPGGTQQVASLGTRTVVANRNVNSLWQDLIFDPSDPSYAPSPGDTNKQFGIGRVVNFGEDNAGNLYIIDMGGNRGDSSFGQDYPAHGQGEIFRLVQYFAGVNVTVDRETGEMTFANETGATIDIRGYSLVSGKGAINVSEFTPVTGRLDAMPNGDGSIDANNFWTVTSAPGSLVAFSEESTGTETTLADGQGFTLSPANGWIKSKYEDVQLKIEMADSSIAYADVEYIGNDGVAFASSDLNFNGELDPDDWEIFKDNHGHVPGGLSPAQAYGFGDLDGDGDNDFSDFRIFQADYIAANGAGAFAGLVGEVPEPGSIITALVGLAGVSLSRRRRLGVYLAERGHIV